MSSLPDVGCTINFRGGREKDRECDKHTLLHNTIFFSFFFQFFFLAQIYVVHTHTEIKKSGQGFTRPFRKVYKYSNYIK